jgi:hypothetical protein
MSTKRLKFLKRQKINQHDIRIRLESLGLVKRFKAELRLDSYGFPASAAIVLEAKQLLETLRFDLGTVGQPAPSVAHDISRLRGERVMFNLVVLDPTTARKLGTAETIRPNVADAPDDSAIPLLPVDASTRLAPLLWDIDYSDRDQEGHTDAPVLRLDADAANHSAAMFMQSASARAMILPAAMREVLTRVLLVDKEEYDPESRSWRSSWIRFSSRLIDEPPPPLDDANAVDETIAWIGRATQAVAKHAGLLDAYVREQCS